MKAGDKVKVYGLPLDRKNLIGEAILEGKALTKYEVVIDGEKFSKEFWYMRFVDEMEYDTWWIVEKIEGKRPVEQYGKSRTFT